MKYKSKNPFLTNKSFISKVTSRKEDVHQATVINYYQEMTLSGTIDKTLLLFLLLIASAIII
jgi:hypothetical protein